MRLLPTVLLLLACPLTATADSTSTLLRRAQSGNAAAMCTVGLSMCAGANGFKKQTAEGVQWLRKSAAKGDTKAMIILGDWSRRGKNGLKKSDAMAYDYYMQAYRAGDRTAATNAEALSKGYRDAFRKEVRTINSGKTVEEDSSTVIKGKSQMIREFLQAMDKDDKESMGRILKKYPSFANEPLNNNNEPALLLCKNAKQCALLLEAGAYVNVSSGGNNPKTPFSHAVESGDFQWVKMLVEAGADVNQNPYVFYRLARHLPKQDMDKVFQYFLDHGLDLKDNGIKKHILCAAISSNVSNNLIIKLLESGVPLDVVAGHTPGTANTTPLLLALKRLSPNHSKGEDIELVKILLKKGVDVNFHPDRTPTPLVEAINRGNQHVVYLLVTSGADVNATSGAPGDQDPPLHTAVKKWHTGFNNVEWMVAYGAKVDWRDPQGKTASFYALKPQIKQYLVDKENEVVNAEHTPDIEKRNTALRRLLETNNLSALSELNRPLTKHEGLTVLQWAAREGRDDLCALALEAGAIVNGTGDKGLTPLYYACTLQHIKCVKLLCDAGADLKIRYTAGSPILIMAIAAPYIQSEGRQLSVSKAVSIVRLLIAAGADVNAPNNIGTTPLMTAVMVGDASSARLLLEAGADPGLKNLDGKTALDLAKGTCADLIREHMGK